MIRAAAAAAAASQVYISTTAAGPTLGLSCHLV